MAKMPAISREYLYIPGIRAFDPRSPDAAADPTGLPVQMAFVPSNTEPTAGDWVTGDWESATTARILLGTGGVVLTKGKYDVWLRVTGAVEQPQRYVGAIQLT